MSSHLRFAFLLALAAAPAFAASSVEKFQQLDQLRPSPTPQRTAAGAPGAACWQNRVDYTMEATPDDEARRLTSRGTITYAAPRPTRSPTSGSSSTRTSSRTTPTPGAISGATTWGYAPNS